MFDFPDMRWHIVPPKEWITDENRDELNTIYLFEVPDKHLTAFFFSAKLAEQYAARQVPPVRPRVRRLTLLPLEETPQDALQPSGDSGTTDAPADATRDDHDTDQ